MPKPVSLTAYYCAGTRMLDARRPDPLINDHYAERFLGEDGKAVFENFRDLAVPIGAHQVRCFLIDEMVRAQLAQSPDTLVVLVGAGFDSRAFRLRGGRFVELDDEAIITRKEAVAPAASCPNRLDRVAVDFEKETLAGKLARFATEAPTAVICEGVTMYLEPAEVEALAAALQSAFPRHRLLADLMTRGFAARYAARMSDRLAAIGTAFRGLEDRPLARFERLGYQSTSVESLLARSIAMRGVPIPPFVSKLLWLFPTLRDGYCVVALEFGAGHGASAKAAWVRRRRSSW